MADILYSYCLTLLGDNMDMQIVIPGAAFKKKRHFEGPWYMKTFLNLWDDMRTEFQHYTFPTQSFLHFFRPSEATVVPFWLTLKSHQKVLRMDLLCRL